MDGGGSKQKHVLLNKTCYQTCTRRYRFDIPAQKTADAFSSSKKDTASIAVRKQPSLYMYVTPPYRRNWLWGVLMTYYISIKLE